MGEQELITYDHRNRTMYERPDRTPYDRAGVESLYSNNEFKSLI